MKENKLLRNKIIRMYAKVLAKEKRKDEIIAKYDAEIYELRGEIDMLRSQYEILTGHMI